MNRLGKKPDVSRPLFVIEHRGYKSACWIWARCRQNEGYGVWRKADGGTTLAHRRIWQMIDGPLDRKIELDHLCRQRDCVRPDHLEPVTRSVNETRARQAKGYKIPVEQELEMQKMRDSGMILKDLAKHFGVSLSWTHNICTLRRPQ